MFGVADPIRGVLPVEQHDVEVLGLRGAAHVVEALARVGVRVGGDLGHELIALTGKRLQRFAEHRGRDVGFGGLEEADAAVVGVVDEAVELLLAERGLHVAVVGAGAEGEPAYLHATLAEGDGIGGGTAGLHAGRRCRRWRGFRQRSRS